MGDEDKNEPKSEDEAPRDYEQLNKTQRWLAGLVGLAGVGAGGAAIFISSNQAGSTTMLLVSLVFLLIAIQGTPIRRAGKDSVEMVGHRIARRVNETLEKSGPEAAREALNNYSDVSPHAQESPPVADAALAVADAFFYEERAAAALLRAVPPGWTVTRQGGPGRWDAELSDSDGRTRIFVEMKYIRHGRLPIAAFAQAAQKLEDLAHGAKVPLLLLANADIPPYIYSKPGHVRTCRWRDETDDSALAAAVSSLIATTASN